jgi:hypothetical protein
MIFLWLVFILISTLNNKFQSVSSYQTQENEVKHHHRVLTNDENEVAPQLSEKSGITAQRGIAMCSSRTTIHDALSLMNQIRNIWQSSLPIAVMHCDEIGVTSEDPSDMKRFKEFANNLLFVDICKNNGVYSSSNENETTANPDSLVIPIFNKFALAKRLRSWYCKSAALLFAPFQEVLVVDLDTIWFKKPDTVFDYSGYQKSGALFFRDRFYHYLGTDPTKKSFHELTLDLFNNYSLPKPTKQYAKEQIGKNGIVYFWRNLANKADPQLENYQDSSVLVLDRSRHPRFLKILASLIPSFNIGWGDKEMYWMTAVISREEFTFEPFLTGNYGPCGFILHFDPNDSPLKEQALPLYANAEWFLEKAQVIAAGTTFLFLSFSFLTSFSYL